jgi:biopolymer transport protein ExbB/TolQ
MLWGTFLILDKCRTILKTNFLFNVEYIEVGNDKTFSVEHAIDNIDKGIEEKYKEMPLIKTIRSALWRYAATRNVQNLSDAIESSVEAMTVRQEAENSMIRYLIWAIPSIGFIGTVRGIGEALSLADKALAGDIAGMTDSLGVAFNSTLVALLLSIFLMFLFHQLQRLQDGLVVQIQEYCDRHILAKLK